MSFVLKGSSYHFVMRYCLCLCVHILSLVHVVSLDICEVKIVAQACIQKIYIYIYILKTIFKRIVVELT